MKETRLGELCDVKVIYQDSNADQEQHQSCDGGNLRKNYIKLVTAMK